MAAFGGARGPGARAPEKGIFPLDHFGECKKVADAYRACLNESDTDAGRCKEIAQQYLRCRMDRNLMARQEMDELGFKQAQEAAAAAREEQAQSAAAAAAEQRQTEKNSGAS